MIISRTPFRISLCGGGSDLLTYIEHGIPGIVLSAAINRYVYVSVNKKFDGRVRACYSKTEDVEVADDLEHDLIRESLLLKNIRRGVEIHSCADIPSGTGLGSSSSFTVGLLHALIGSGATPSLLARQACEVEILRCEKPIGKQDQYISAFGGVRLFRFETMGNVTSSEMPHREVLEEFNRYLLLLWTGRKRSADLILHQQSSRMIDPQYRGQIARLSGRALSFARALSSQEWEVCGEILHESWEIKRELSNGVTDPQIDDWYTRAREKGAFGGKICGAGGGGFLLLTAPPDRHQEICNDLQLKRLPFRFDFSGSTIIHSSSTGG